MKRKKKNKKKPWSRVIWEHFSRQLQLNEIIGEIKNDTSKRMK
jgi:hypothetical protein